MNRLARLFPLAALRRHALLLFTLLLTAPLPALTSGNFTYEVSNGDATITDFSWYYSGALTIPSTLGGYPVTSIGSDAFYDCRSLTSVTIPAGVTSIGSSAFAHCSSLTSVTIPEGVTSIGSSAFAHCSSLTSVTIPESVTSIGNLAFSGCSSRVITVSADNALYASLDGCLFNKDYSTLLAAPGVKADYVIPSSVTSIGDDAFAYCYSLTSVTIPSSVTSIGDYAFYNCSSLTSVTIPSGVTTIGDGAFFGCSSLPRDENGIQYESQEKRVLIEAPESLAGEFVIPSSVRFVHISAFLRCSSLTSVTIPASVTTIGIRTFYGCSSLTSVTIPSSVTSIGDYAFYECSSLTSVTIPASVTSIGDYAFYECSSLTSVTIPASVTSIGDYAFYECSSLTSVTIPEGVTSIGNNAFYGCSSITEVTIPLSVTAIGDCAFECVSPERLVAVSVPPGMSTKKLTSVTIPEGVTSIGDRAFYGFSSLRSVTIPSSVTSIGSSAFRGCSSLTSVSIPEGVTSIASSAFAYCSSLTSVTIPSSVTSIASSAFVGCSSLVITVSSDNASYASLDGCLFNKDYSTLLVGPGVKDDYVIPASVTSIGDYAFYECSSLTSVTIPEGVTSIGNQAFEYCSSLTSVTIPASVTSIGSWAFYGCRSLTSVTIPSSVTTIGDKAFSGVVPEVLIASRFPAGSGMSTAKLTTLIVQEGTETIAARAFAECSAVTSVTIPESVTSIGDQTFWGCSSLTSVTIPASVTSIGRSAFWYCSSLTSVTIPESVTSIGDQTFSGCSSLTSVTIPEGVTSIGDSAFGNCCSLTSVTIPSSVTYIAASAFSGCSSLMISVNVNNPSYASQDGCLFNKAYTALLAAPSVAGKYVIPEGVTSIGRSAFRGCRSLTSVTISEGVTSIGDSAFSGCRSLTSVKIPEGVTSIGNHAFEYCSSLTSVTIPASVTSIGSWAFYYCRSLTSVTIPEGVATIGDHAFSNCSSLTSVTIPSSVTSIGSWAFSDCSSLTSVTISSSVTSIGSWAFSDCASLLEIRFEGGVPRGSGQLCNGKRVGIYRAKYANEWTAALDAAGSWRGLTMRLLTSAITYINLRGTTHSNPERYAEGVEYTFLPPSELSGYTFLGWTPAVIEASMSGDQVVSAAWEANRYAIGYNANGGEGEMASTPATYDQSVALAANTFTREGYTFKGWATTSTGAVAYRDRAEVRNLTAVAEGTVTLYAVWEGVPYAIAYNANGGFGDMVATQATYGEAINLSANAFTRAGYTFKGWATTSTGTVAYGNGGEVRNLTAEAGDVVTLYAIWEINRYTITYNANGGEGEMESTAATYGETVTLRPACLTRAKYLFKGWALTAAGEVVYGDGAEVSNLTDEADGVVTLYAVWEKRDEIHLRAAVAKQRFPWNGVVDIEVSLEEDGLLTEYPEDYGFRLRAVDQTSQEVYVPSAEALTLTVPTSGVQQLTWDVARDYPSLVSRELCFTVEVVEKPEEVVSSVQAAAIVYDATVASRVIGASEVSALPYNPAWAGGDTVRVTINGELWHTDTQAGEKAWVPEETLYYSLVYETLREGEVIETLTATVQGALAQQVATPILTVRADDKILASTITEGAMLHYTVDGSEPTKQSPMTSGLLVLSGSGTLKVRAMKLGWIPSGVATYEHTSFVERNVEASLSQGSVPWRKVTLDGTQVWQSGSIGHSASSVMTLTLTGPGTLTFRWKVSSERYDWLSFLCNGAQIQRISGTQDWQTITYSKTDKATATFTWQYTKDGSVSSGSDCGWVDAVMWTGAVANTLEVESCPYDSASRLYYLLTNSEVTVLSYAQLPEDGQLVIPAEIVGLPVTTIDDEAFANCTSLTSVTLPNSVTTIGENAFLGVAPAVLIASRFPAGSGMSTAKLTTLIVPVETETITARAFAGCSALTSVTIPSSVTSISSSAFYRVAPEVLIASRFPAESGMSAEKLATVIVLKGTEAIMAGAFSGCSSLTSVTIPEGVTSIGDEAFSGCRSLAEVTLPASVTVIGSSAFRGCSALTAVEIPASVTSLGAAVFADCSSLASVTLPEGITAMGDSMFSSCAALTAIEIPSSVTAIGASAFRGCSALTSIVIPEAVTTLGDAVFAGCSSLASVTLPEGITAMGNSMFSGCAALTAIEIPASVKTIRASAFADCTSLTTLTIPDGVTSIGSSAFAGCTSLTSVTLPNSVKTIGASAFAGCTSLATLTIPDGVTSIGASAFSGCTSLTSVAIPNSVTTIGENAFSGVAPKVLIASRFPAESGMSVEQLTTVIVPEGTKTIAAGAFAGCSAVTSVTLPASVKTIGSSAFRGCSALTTVEIPEAVTTLGDAVFADCTSLASVTLPEGITAMSDSIFSGCAALTAIEIPASVKTIRASAFADCTSLATLTIPDGVTSIGSSAFAGCRSLTSVAIPESVKTIGASAFADCTSLATVTIPDGVTSIGSSAFAGCRSLTSVTIPNSVTTIGGNAFSGVAPKVLIASRFPAGSGMSTAKLTTLIVPEGTKTIAAGAFAGCSAVTSVVIPASVTEMGEEAFTGVAPTTLVAPFLPSGMSTANLTEVTLTTAATVIPEAAFAGNTVLRSIALPAGVTAIGARAFEGCSALKRVEIPASVTEIGARAFAECTGLTEVVFAEGLAKVGDEAFWGCSAVEEMVLPASLTTLGERVFTGCNRVLVAERNRNYKSVDGVLFSANNEYLLHFPVYRGGEYATPVNVHFVREEAFMGNTALTQVYLADITNLEPRAFKDCGGLIYCFATEGLLTIEANAFENATELRAFSVPASVWLLEDGAFKNCPKLNLIAFRGTVPRWTGTVFSGMALDQTRSTYPAEYAASWEAALDGSLMWDGLKMVADYYYDGTDGNYQYRVYGGEATITGTTVPLVGEVRLPMTLDGYLVTGIGAQAFATSTGLTNITFPKSLLSIGDYAFFFCRKLQSVTFEGRPMTKGTAPTKPFPANTTAVGNYPAELESAWSKVIQAGYYYGLRMGLVEVQIILDGEGEVRGAGTYHIDEVVTLEAIPAKGQRFVEWTFVDGTSTENPITFTAKEACYVMATFEADPTAIVISNITYENLMGATHRNPATYEEGTEYTFKTPSEVTGYTFQGWQPAAIDSSMTGDQTIRATWRANGYTVVYAANGGMGSMDHTAAVYDVPFSLRTNAFTFSGRRFCGWALTADGPVTYADSAEVRNLTAVSEGVVTLYAIWEKMPFLPGDSTATIEGSAEAGWTVKPSGGVKDVVISIPEGVEAAKVTVEVPSTVTSVTANGATIKVVKVDGETRHDITPFLNIPAAVAGKIDLTQAEVKTEIAKAILDTSETGGAVFDPSAKQPLTTAPTKPGLTYTLWEGDSIDNPTEGDSKVGDGQPWQPRVTKYESSAFYRIRVSK